MRYVAFLRAVNVGGRTIRMERLRQIFSEAGFSNVETFIASGNVIFDSRATSLPGLERKIEAALEAALAYPVATFVRRAEDLSRIAEHQPFPVDGAGSPGGTIHVGFLRAPLTPAERRALLALRTDVDEFDTKGQEIYWLIKGNMLDSQVPAPVMGRTLREVTLRNRKTIVRLATKLGAPPGR